MTKDFPISEEQLKETILMMNEQGFVSGRIIKTWGDDVLIDYNTLKITPAGIDYMRENSTIRKICEKLKEAIAIWELFT